MTDKELITALKRGDSDALQKVYLDHRSSFLNFARKFRLSREEVLDTYQDAIIALRENAINGKLDGLNSTVKTYLFSIGKYMIYAKLKRQQKNQLIHANFELPEPSLPEGFQSREAETREHRLLRAAFGKLGIQCQKVLSLFYLRGYTLVEIAEAMSYRSKDVVKSQKSRCLKSLKEMIAGSR